MATYSPQQLGISAPAGGFQTGGWYSGRQYWNGSLSDPGVEHPESNSATAGKAVNQEVRAASAAAQGVSIQDFNTYLSNASALSISPPTTPTYTANNGESNYVLGLNQEVEKARQTLDQNLLDQRNKTQAELAVVKGKESAALGEVDKLTTPFREDLEKTERGKYGTEGVLVDQKELLSELDQLLTEGNNLIKQQQGTTGLASIRNPRIQKTMDDVAARAGVINAVVSLQNTYLANAYNAIDRSIGAITQDRQDRLSYYETVLNLANRDIVTLTAQDKEIANEQISLLKYDLERSTETVDYIKKLMINPDTALVMAQSGVTLNDSVKSINQKMSQYQYATEIRTLSNEMSKSGYSVITNPSSVPSSQLVKITDSSGVTYYYKKNLTGSGFDASQFLKTLSTMGYKVSGEDTKETETSIIDTESIWNEVLSNDYSTYAGKPSFYPAGGVGTIWTDGGGKNWIFTSEGWTSYTSSAAGNGGGGAG